MVTDKNDGFVNISGLGKRICLIEIGCRVSNVIDCLTLCFHVQWKHTDPLVNTVIPNKQRAIK